MQDLSAIRAVWYIGADDKEHLPFPEKSEVNRVLSWIMVFVLFFCALLSLVMPSI